MARILTGIQSSGTPHLGNLLGAIIPAIELSKDPNNESLFFIADMHSLTTIRDANLLKENTYATAAAWIAFGFDTERNLFYRQSDIPQVCELMWYLNCLTPYPMLANAHSFKDKSSKLHNVNAGLFTYPVLMAADILLYDAHIVPVGKDQIQHIEMTRDMAGAFNHIYGETLIEPEVMIDEKVMTIPGTDGQKMSKSYNNFINIFLPDKKLRKQIMSIETSSTAMEEPKETKDCNVFNLYNLLASEADSAQMKANYEGGNYGYGHAKQALFELITKKYTVERTRFNELMNNQSLIEEELQKGAVKARKIAEDVLQRVRTKVGY
ncbi:tryptophan--tRNA ligase [Flavobacteriales bacterium]|nr:tryptophan--tRNA ligase [Flavobacteriales bacterium]MDB2653062.1 tryptophan--tRNA ligase [Flavobacteriales bacterium]MDG1395970.1 tryptophan--tRNA ligase [Flavobacteriales bacterium]